MRNSLVRLLALGALPVTAGLALACAPSSGSEATAEAATGGAAGFPPVTIRFSDPGNGGVTSVGGVLAYAKRERILERELAKVNAKIEWVPGPAAFSANFEAMNSGAINASGAAVSPIVGALAHNLRFQIFSVGSSTMTQSGIIVPGASSIRSVKDLVGKRVAVNLAAHGDYILLKALEKEGIPASSVERVPIQPPDAAAAFATGKIDAWATFGVFFSTAVRKGARVLVLEADIGSDDVNILSANADVLARNPAAFQVFLRVVNELVDVAREHPERFQNVFTTSGPTAVSGEELALAIEQTRTLQRMRVPTEEDRRRIAAVSELLTRNRSIDRTIGVDEVVFDIDAAVARGTQGPK